MPLMGDLLNKKPDRLQLGNASTGEVLEVQFNPTDVDENIAVEYARQVVLGLSHQVLQYQSTGNFRLGFTLSFDSLVQSSQRYDIMAARRFLMTHAYARRGAQDVRAGAPPRMLIMWPNLYALNAKLISYGGKLSRFQSDGTPTAFTIRIECEEIRDVYLFSDDVALVGTTRAPGTPGTTL